MNDKDIIKALECCGKSAKCDGANCPMYTIPYDDGKDCASSLMFNALDLIKRQQEEIEKLTIQKNAFGAGMKVEARKNDDVRAEAIKEFA